MQPYKSSLADCDVHLERRRRMPRGPHPSPSDGYELVRTLEYCSNQTVTSCDGEYEHAYGVSYDQSCDALCPSSLHPQLIPFARLKNNTWKMNGKAKTATRNFRVKTTHRRPLKNRSTLRKLPQKIGFQEGTESNTPSEECSIALESLWCRNATV